MDAILLDLQYFIEDTNYLSSSQYAAHVIQLSQNRPWKGRNYNVHYMDIPWIYNQANSHVLIVCYSIVTYPIIREDVALENEIKSC